MENEYYKLIPNKTKKELNFEFDFEVNYNGKTKELAIFELCQEFNLFFDCNLAKDSRGLGDYIKHITLLPQYENKKFGDSVIKEKEMELINGYEKDLENSKMLKEWKLSLLDALRNEQQMLLQKMKKAIDEDNIGTYKNLVLALKEITYLVNSEEDKFKGETIYVEIDRELMQIYFKQNKKITKVENIVVARAKIEDFLNRDKNICICIDCTGIGIGLYDELKSRGYKVVKAERVG